MNYAQRDKYPGTRDMGCVELAHRKQVTAQRIKQHWHFKQGAKVIDWIGSKGRPK